MNAPEKVEDDELRTIDLLRGRLLAERMATRTAKEEVNKLTEIKKELERKLAEETRCWRRAEKSLKYALKRLESLENGSEGECEFMQSYSCDPEAGRSDRNVRFGNVVRIYAI